ncbi:VanZ family protein [Carnobacteriaceae bacterium zg-ZUI252]|nr:VanZ family protein [Carnobacteriaceae bacterium zg-ZUI252]MBS4770375.1 VanZ family protein [Carnobacteriaceae bacterium zg-ZUI240]
MGTILDILAYIGVYYFVCLPRWRKRGESVLIVRTLFSFYLLVVLMLTVSPVVTSLPFIFNAQFSRMVNMMPFVDILDHRDFAISQVVLNILLTIPFGFFLPGVYKMKKQAWMKTVFATFLFSLTIELTQFILANGRITDITDILTNTFGGVVGFALYRAIKLFVHRHYNPR